MAAINLDKIKELIEANKSKSEACKELSCSLAALNTAYMKLMVRDDRFYKWANKSLKSDTVRVGKNGALIIAKSRIPTFSAGDVFGVKVDGNKITLTKK